MRTLASFALALALGGCTAGRAALEPGGVGAGVVAGTSAVTPNQMRLEWQPEVRGDRTRLTGYVYNDYVLPARDIVLLVEGLDGAGHVTDRIRAHVDRVLTPGNRSYWEASLPRPAAAYRVSVASLHWISSDR